MFRYRRKREIKLPREIARWLRGIEFILLGVVLLVVVAILSSRVPRIGWLLLVIIGLPAVYYIMRGAKELGVEL
jgi:amino acid transporter